MLDPNDFRELMVSLPENETSTARLSHHTGRSESQSSQLKAAEHRFQESQSNEAYNVNHLDKAQKKKNGTCSGSANAILDQNVSFLQSLKMRNSNFSCTNLLLLRCIWQMIEG